MRSWEGETNFVGEEKGIGSVNLFSMRGRKYVYWIPRQVATQTDCT